MTKKQTNSPTRRDAAEASLVGLLDTDEAALYVKIGRRTFQEKVAAREITYVKIGRSIRFDPRDLDVFIERHKVKAVGWKVSAKPTTTLKNARKTGEILGLSPSQMSELLKAGAITPEIHEGSLIRYDVEKVRKQLAKRARDRAAMNHPGDMVPTL